MGIIDEKFDEWTGGTLSRQSRITVFEKVRNIPYGIYYDQLNLTNGPSSMLRRGKGSCSPKHYLLGLIYERMGVKVRYCTYPFRWSDMNVGYPGTLKDLAAGMPVTYHLACSILVDGKWTLVDATWEPALKPAGFPVNEQWDGKSDTVLAVKPLDEYVHDEAGLREKFFQRRAAGYTLPEKLELSRFSLELNKWLDEIRRKP